MFEQVVDKQFGIVCRVTARFVVHAAVDFHVWQVYAQSFRSRHIAVDKHIAIAARMLVCINGCKVGCALDVAQRRSPACSVGRARKVGFHINHRQHRRCIFVCPHINIVVDHAEGIAQIHLFCRNCSARRQSKRMHGIQVVYAIVEQFQRRTNAIVAQINVVIVRIKEVWSFGKIVVFHAAFDHDIAIHAAGKSIAAVFP